MVTALAAPLHVLLSSTVAMSRGTSSLLNDLLCDCYVPTALVNATPLVVTKEGVFKTSLVVVLHESS
jgi:hypothetical protein